jgi:hypothetical protein
MLTKTGLTDRSLWGRGPWDDEPDRAVWVDEDTGLDCLVCRSNGLGSWCGYVGLPPGHPWYGLGYDDIPAQAHGGLTYSAPCDGDPESGICHVPAPGAPEHLYWIGFDCAHTGDFWPVMNFIDRWLDPIRYQDLTKLATYRTLAYVQEETRQLARQAHAA